MRCTAAGSRPRPCAANPPFGVSGLTTPPGPLLVTRWAAMPPRLSIRCAVPSLLSLFLWVWSTAAHAQTTASVSAGEQLRLNIRKARPRQLTVGVLTGLGVTGVTVAAVGGAVSL